MLRGSQLIAHSLLVGVGLAMLLFPALAQAQSTPTPLFPANGAMDVLLPVTLEWSEVSGATGYAVVIGTASDPFAGGSLIITGSTELTQSLELGTTYYWAVRAQLSSGTGAYSSVFSFTTVSTLFPPDDAPELVAPLDGADEVETDVQFKWMAVSNAVGYDLQISDDPDFPSASTRQEVTRELNKLVDSLPSGTQLYWRVRGRNAAGGGPWSTASFTTRLEAPTASPALLTPSADASVSVPVTLTWSAVDQAATYQLQVSAGSSFPDNGNTTTFSDLTDTTFVLSSFPADVFSYYWRVRAVNSAGSGPDSEARRFFVVFPTDLEAPVLVAPENEALDVSVDPTVFEWGGVSEADAYIVQVAEAGDFEGSLAVDSKAHQGTTFEAQGLAPSAKYEWRVKALECSTPFDEDACTTSPVRESAWSSIWSFATDGNVTPTVANPLADRSLALGGNAFTVDLNSVFADADGDPLTFTASVPTSEVLAATVVGSTLTVEAVGVGQATVTVQATDPAGATAQDAFDVTVEEGTCRPVASADGIADQTLVEGGSAQDIDLASVFTCPNGESISYAAASSSIRVGVAVVGGSTLRLTPRSVGRAQVTVTASASGGGTDVTFTATVIEAGANPPPVVIAPMGTAGLVLGDPAQSTLQIALNEVFSDPEGETLTFTLMAPANEEVVAAQVSGATLTVEARASGTVHVIVEARDERGATAEDTLTVSVREAANESPVIVQPIGDRTLVVGAPASNIDLRPVATDPNGDPLTYEVASVVPAGLVSAVIEGETTLKLQALAEGAAAITVSISDGLLVVQDTFTATARRSTAVAVEDSLALLSVAQALGRSSWTTQTNWEEGAVDTWYGVTVEEGRVVGLSLGANNVQGDLPQALTDLTRLRVLELQQNDLTGPLPASLIGLPDLETLNLAENELTGSIPASIGDLASLQYLNLADNEFTGPLPDELGSLGALRELLAYENQLTGGIPASLGSLERLEVLELYENRLSGTLPQALGSLRALRRMDLGTNQFGGAVPASFRQLLALTDLLLEVNQFTDVADLSNLSQLDTLIVRFNQLDFGAIEHNLSIPNYAYAPQDSIGRTQTVEVVEDNAVTLDIGQAVGGLQNTYQWYREGVRVEGATTPTLTLSSVRTSDAGTYWLEVSNTQATELILVSRRIRVDVETGGGTLLPPPLVAPEDGGLVTLPVTLSWTPVAGATSYRVQVASTSTFDELVVDHLGSSASHTVGEADGLMPNSGYFWRVRAEASNQSSTFASVRQFEVYPTQVSVAVNQTFGNAENAQSYRLVGLPGVVDLDIAETLQGQPGEFEDWRVFRELGSTGTHPAHLQEYDGSSSFRFRPGRGFWLLSKGTWTVNRTVETVPLVAARAAEITLQPGWNIVSNPLDEDVLWSAVEQANGGTLQPLYRFRGQFSTSTSFASAQTGEAYYFFNATGLTELVLPHPDASVQPSVSKQDLPHEPSLVLKVEAHGQTRANLLFMLSQEGDKKLDPLDTYVPPSYFSGVSMYWTGAHLVHDAELESSSVQPQLHREVQALGQEGYTTELVVAASDSKDPLQVTLDASGWLSSRPHDQIVLIDTHTGQRHTISPREALQVPTSRDTTRYRVMIGVDAYVSAAERAFVPTQVLLLGNYPNPFQSSTTIAYAVPSSMQGQRIQLAVFDLLGRRLATLVDAAHEPGRYTVQWHVGEGGARFASGVYIVQLTSEQQVLTREAVLLR
ncbi:MAG: T9SS type A sorting domain-containing protein [Bacteroidota bacterium]